jgi:uncharacterized protein
MLPRFPEFKKLTLADREAFERHMAAHPREICELSFATLTLWKDFDRAEAAMVGDTLCVRVTPLDEPPFFLEPVGAGDVTEAAKLCIADAGRISRATAGFVERIRGDGFCATAQREHYDYVYRVEDLAELRGRRYDGKRNHIKGLRRRHPAYGYRALRKADAPAASALFEQWCRSHPPVRSGCFRPEDLEYDCQRKALARAFEAFDELGLFGGALLIGGEMAGFVIASRLTTSTACAHLEYHRADVPGIAQTLLWEACRGTFERFEFVNLEQDLGIEGLRKHKTSYHPVRLEEKFEVVQRQSPSAGQRLLA